jgi:predicted nucleic acid-binding protein
VKLVVDEPESADLAAHLESDDAVIATSSVALVEVPRATSIANPSREVQSETARLLESCLLLAVSEALLRVAAGLASVEIRTLDAIHLASAQWVEPDEVLTYDRRLREAARRLGFAVAHPGQPD